MINQDILIKSLQRNIKTISKSRNKYLNTFYGKKYQQAAVIILITKENNDVLFIKRSTDLRLHKGEIGFPGGKVEKIDKSLMHTALRELYEEIKLHRSQVEIVGTLPEIITTSGFVVTPIIGLISKYCLYFSDSDEVEAIISVPLDVLLTKSNHKEKPYGKKKIHLYFYQKHVIWGATASIVSNLISYF